MDADEDTIFVSSSPFSQNLSSELSDPLSDTNTFDSSPPPSISSSFTSQRRRYAWIWRHMPDSDPNTVYFNKQNHSIWKCHYCPRVYRESGGTRIISRHLKENHQIYEDSKREERQKLVQQSIQQAMATAELSASSYKRRRLLLGSDDIDDELRPIDPAVLEILTVKWLASCHLPAYMVECPEFKALTTYLNSQSQRWLGGADTVSKWVYRTMKDQQEIQQIEIGHAKSKVHLIIDCWSSNSQNSVIGFIVKYVNRHYQLTTEPIALQHVDGSHTGANLSQMVYKVIDQWGFQGNFGHLMMDNATNMDATARELSTCKLYSANPSVTNRFYRYGRLMGYRMGP